VASDPVISRLIGRLADDAPAALTAIGNARAIARERAWQLTGSSAPAVGGELIIADIRHDSDDRSQRQGAGGADVEEFSELDTSDIPGWVVFTDSRRCRSVQRSG
jgi:hypothetical protein